MKLHIREVSDIESLMKWRMEVIEAVFGGAPTPELLETNRRYYLSHIPDGSHLAIVADFNGAEAGCGAICMQEELPSPENHSGRCAYLMNIYVRPQYRGCGIGHAIVRWLVAHAREVGCDKIYLETTREANALYISIGFETLPGIMRYADIHDWQP